MTDQSRSPEQALEILAREMFVEDAVSTSSGLSANWRGRWYESPRTEQGRWRIRAASLLASLGQSALELTWRES